MSLGGEEVLKAIRERRTVRSFKPDKVPRELLTKVLDAARWSPSGSNAQEWRFIVVTNERVVKALRMFSPGWLNNAPAVIAVCVDREWAYRKAGELGRDRMYLIDIGIAIQTIALAAHALGLGTNIMLSFSPEAVKEILNPPPNWEVVALIAIGYPERIPKAPPRLPLEELVVWR